MTEHARDRLPPVRLPLPPSDEFAARARLHTPASVGVGRRGTRYPTSRVLQFQAELAVAQDAVHEVLPIGWFAERGMIEVSSRVRDRDEYLLRPDLGRRLDGESLAKLHHRDVDVVPILADGLSALACRTSGPELLGALVAACEARGLSVGAPVGARFARVWLEDEIGALTGARVAVILLGERPGLGTGDGLSAYLVHDPRLGRTDAERNMISNIHARGLAPATAAARLAAIAATSITQGVSGVALDLTPIEDELGDSARGGYWVPAAWPELVRVGTR